MTGTTLQSTQVNTAGVQLKKCLRRLENRLVAVTNAEVSAPNPEVAITNAEERETRVRSTSTVSLRSRYQYQ